MQACAEKAPALTLVKTPKLILMTDPSGSIDFSQNRITRLLGIQVPVIQAGMVWCSGWELASAVSNAGGLGVIGSGSMDPATLRTHIRKCRAATTQPFAVNVPLLYRHIGENISVILQEGVKIVFSSAGNPATWTPELKSAGITVIHVVSSKKFGLKAEDAGVDALVAEGFEAGGHNGREELTTLVLVPQVCTAVGIPVIAAGGIATGAGMLAALALGAEGVQVGSRFVASEESSAHLAFKELIIRSPEDATQLTLKELNPVRLMKNRFFQEVMQAYQACADKEELSRILGHGRARKGMFEGDLEEGELEIGQVSGMIREILPAARILENMLAEYASAKLKLY
jgi:enoyl-[acyl-carrier protein] reductase II